MAGVAVTTSPVARNHFCFKRETESGESAVLHCEGYANVRDALRPNIGHAHSNERVARVSGVTRLSLLPLPLQAATSTTAAIVQASAPTRCVINRPPELAPDRTHAVNVSCGRRGYGAASMPERVEADVCVVGAGYAGLTAARRLTEDGKSVVVVEARDRVGGRIWTQRLASGLSVDRGGAWLGPKHDAIFGLAREVGASTYKTWVKGAHLLIDGDRTRRYTGLIPKISPLAVATIALAQTRIDRLAKKLPLDEPWTAARASEWDSRSVASWLERSGIRTTIARDLFEMAVRGLFTGDLNEVSFLNMLMLVRGHGSINTLFSITDGAQENMVDGGAGSIAQRVADALGDAVHLNAPVRSVMQHDDRVDIVADGLAVTARSVVVTVPPALILEINFDPVLPDDRLALYRGAVAGPETKTLVVYDEPFWRADGFSGQTSKPHSAAEVTIDASPISGASGVHRVVHVRAGRGTLRRHGSRRAPPRRPRRAHGEVRASSRIARRVRRDRVVDGGVDSRLFDGALPPRHPVALRIAPPRAARSRALGRNRDVDDIARRHRRRGALRRARRRRDPRPLLARGRNAVPRGRSLCREEAFFASRANERNANQRSFKVCRRGPAGPSSVPSVPCGGVRA